MGLVLAFLRSQRRVPNANETVNNLKQHTLSCNHFNIANKRVPPAFDKFGKMTFPVSVHVYLMPYLENDDLYQTILLTRGQRGSNETVRIFLSSIDFTQTNRGA